MFFIRISWQWSLCSIGCYCCGDHCDCFFAGLRRGRLARPTCVAGRTADEGCWVPCCPSAWVQVPFLRPSLMRSSMSAPRPVPFIPNHQIRVVAAGLGGRARPGLDECVGPCRPCESSPGLPLRPSTSSRSREWDVVRIPGCPVSFSPAASWRTCAPIDVRFEFQKSCRFPGAFFPGVANPASSDFLWLARF